MHMLTKKKIQLATSFARAIGFISLKDTKTVIRKANLYSGLVFLRKNRLCFIKLFRGALKKRLRNQLHVNQVIKVFRTVLRDQAIRCAVHSTKINIKNPLTGVRTSAYEYRLLV